jgi:hypothetical protein
VQINTQGELSAETLSGRGNLVLEESGTQRIATSYIELINLQTLEIEDGLISASTETGIAGNINVNASDSISITDQLSDGFAAGIRATAEGSALNNNDCGPPTAGSISITTGDLLVRSKWLPSELTSLERAAFSVNSPQWDGGSLAIEADRITLNGGELSATVGQGSGANITIDLPDDDSYLGNILWLENESLISANAGKAATGGNINIVADLILGLLPSGPRGSDIEANAEQGKGGVVDIDALGVFGLEFRLKQTPFNDITANSAQGQQGTVALNTLATDPTSGLVELTLEFVDVSDRPVDQCSVRPSEARSEILLRGHGGLPPMPTGILGVTTPAHDDWVTLEEPVDQTMELVPTAVTATANIEQSTQPAFCHRGYWITHQTLE